MDPRFDPPTDSRSTATTATAALLDGAPTSAAPAHSAPAGGTVTHATSTDAGAEIVTSEGDLRLALELVNLARAGYSVDVETLTGALLLLDHWGLLDEAALGPCPDLQDLYLDQPLPAAKPTPAPLWQYRGWWARTGRRLR